VSTQEPLPLAQHFDPIAAYNTWYPLWEKEGLFTADPKAPGPAFCIVIPPPNVTGSLHMGHALNNSLQDALVRFKRMDGFNTLWVPGTDHAGIATQWVVEKQLRAKGLSRKELGREEFEKRVWAWKAESGGTIVRQLKKLGVSCDWSRERFTMDEGLSKAVREFFVTLYEEGLIYRATRLINWDPTGLTALSDLEVESKEEEGELWSFAYSLSDGSGEIVVATTRPETMLGDTAVAVHPDDSRYQHLVGQTVRHPLLEREIPIIADAILVDPAFGTGAVKITPAHDFNDHEVGKRHNLPQITIFNLDATVNQQGGPFAGMTRLAARTAVKEALTEKGLDRGVKPHRLPIPRSQRSGDIVEPMISTQWFVQMRPLATPAKAAVEHGFTKFWPDSWKNLYFSWVNEIKDWCVSRQLWWGHRIPAWHCADCGKTTVARETPTQCSACGSEKLQQDEDVLDTWFSSALWPFSTLGWPEKTADLARYYPNTVLITAFDIIFFWVARMLFAGTHLMGQVPFKDVYIHGLIRDQHGDKMSKTKGNVVDPLEILDAHGTDAVRMTLLTLSGMGRDVRWTSAGVDGAVHFQNKVWQAFRFLRMHVQEVPEKPASLGVLDRWILVRAGEAVARVRKSMDEYRFQEAAQETQNFIWYELCDWYLEFSKAALYGQDAEARAAARWTLWTVFSAITRLLHPFMPILTEEIWHQLPGTEGYVMKAQYPKVSDFPADPQALQEVALLQEAITDIRRVRSEMMLAKPEFSLIIGEGIRQKLSPYAGALKNLANTVLATGNGAALSLKATLVLGGEEASINLEGLVDVAKERARLLRELEKSRKSTLFLEGRLNNTAFVEKSPVELVEKTRSELLADQARIQKLERALKDLAQ
jgi:valyl-tRNA synthetase